MGKAFRAALCVLALLATPLSVYCDEGEPISIQGVEGRGKDRQLALADAFRNAISQALGTYVVTSRNWDGETLDKKIFDNSDAVVTKYHVVGESEAGGRYSIVINAEIIRNEMMKYIHKDTSTNVGDGELANLLVKRNAIENAVNSLELLFQNWRENIYRVEKYGNLSISADDDVSGDIIHVSVPFIITFRWDSYNVLLAKTRNVLSRIAIDKTQGVCDTKTRGGLAELLSPFYIRTGLARKNEVYSNGMEFQNPNRYGEIRIVTRLADDKIAYEIYIVPNQVKKTLDSILERNAEIKFAFTSKGGRTIAKSSIGGEVYSFGWSRLYACEEIKCSWSYSENYERLIIADIITTDLNRKECAQQRLYHASLPVPLAEASQIFGCDIFVCQKNESGGLYSRISVSSEPIGTEEWNRIDRRPQQVSGAKSAHKPALEARKSAPPAPPVHRMSLSDKDKGLKSTVDALMQLQIDASVAGKWFKLAKNAESKELKQLAFKASGAALVYSKRRDTYNSKVRLQIDDVSAFEKSLKVKCKQCGGAGTRSCQCYVCSGNGNCSSCKGSGKTVSIEFDRPRGWKPCHKCKGNGQCLKCGGARVINQRCDRCYGKGNVFGSEAAMNVYRSCVEKVSELYL